MRRTTLLLLLALAGCAGAPLEEQLPPGFQDLAPPELARVRYESYGGKTELSAVLAPVASGSYGFAWQLLTGTATHRDGQVEVELLFAGPPAGGGDAPLVRVVGAVFALEPPDLDHEGRVDLLPALESPPLARVDLVPEADGPGTLARFGLELREGGEVYLGRFQVAAGRLTWNAKGQAALLGSILYRAADGIFVRENKPMAVSREAVPPGGSGGE